MAYQFYIEVTKAERLKPRRGEYPPQALERLQRIADALRQADPSLVLDTDEGLLEGEGERLGAVLIDPNRVTLQWTSRSSYSALLDAAHDALAVLEPLGLAGYDPQVGDLIRYHAAGPDFLRQFRSQILCPDHEFEQWIHGIEPASWKRRRELRPAFEAGFRQENFPRIEGPAGGEGATSQEALVAALRRVAAHNDAILQRLDLAEALHLFQNENGRPRRRADGSWVPWSLWFDRSSLAQESALLMQLQRLGWKPAIFDQPQWLRISYGEPGKPAAADMLDASEEILRTLWKTARDSGRVEHIGGGSDRCERHVEIETADARALFEVLRPLLQPASGVAVRVQVRCGGPGSPVEDAVP